MAEKAGSAAPAAAGETLAPRVLHMLIFAVVFWVVCWVVAITALVQLALRVFSAAPSPELRRFGAGLARYAGQVIAYLSFATDRLPFPFSDWPEAPTPLTAEDLSGL